MFLITKTKGLWSENVGFHEQKGTRHARSPHGRNSRPLCDHTMALTGVTAAAVTRAATRGVGGGDEVGRTTRGQRRATRTEARNRGLQAAAGREWRSLRVPAGTEAKRGARLRRGGRGRGR
jgi:hypothetical protein